MEPQVEQKTPRNSSVEAFRMFLMLGICMIHSIGCCGHGWIVARDFFMPSVVGFILLTGWFGASLKLSKILRLCGMAIYASVILRIMDLFFMGGSAYGNSWNLISWFHYWWFLNSYICFLVMTPFLNSLVECLYNGRPKVRSGAAFGCGMIVLLTFGVGFIAYQFKFEFPFRNLWCPFVEPCSFMVFTGIYIIGRVCRVSCIFERLGYKSLLVLGAIGMTGVFSGLSSYNSPFSLFVAVSALGVFWKLFGKDDNFATRRMRWCVSLLAPSSFSIYLLHSNWDVGFVAMRSCEDGLVSIGMPVCLVWLTAGVVAFAAGVVLDVPRRLMAWFAASWIDRSLSILDKCVEYMLSKSLKLCVPI